jgi:hypothetical protein
LEPVWQALQQAFDVVEIESKQTMNASLGAPRLRFISILRISEERECRLEL